MRIAIVTGASSGMGRETAIQLADRFGHRLSEIWLIARRQDRLKELVGQVPVRVRILPLDLTDSRDAAEFEQQLKKNAPQVLFLANAAGFGKIGKTGDIPLQDELDMIELNCKALCRVTHMVLPYLVNGGRILQYSSAAAFLPQPKFAVYAATKSFVLSYSRALNTELRKRRITVTAVCPGPVKTEFFTIAETTGKIPMYKKLTMADAKKVVSRAIRDCMAKKSISVYGPLMKAFLVLSKVLPHQWILKIWL